MSTWGERLKAAAHHEVSRAGLDPYRAAGAGVYEYVMELEAQRGQAPSRANLQVALLAAWVAFALQVLGDEMLDADAALDPATAHYVPPVTAVQVTAFYQPVQAWMARAKAAKANPSYLLDVPIPAVLPEWVEAEPCPAAHLRALRQAVVRLGEQTENAVASFDPATQDARARDLVAQGSAEASSAAEYANSLWGAATGPPPPQMHETIEQNLKQAAETYFYLGQLLAMPGLAHMPKPVRRAEEEDSGGHGSFLQTVVSSYPHLGGQGRRGGLAAVIGGGLLGSILGEGLAQEIFGGGGGYGGGGFGGGMGWYIGHGGSSAPL